MQRLHRLLDRRGRVPAVDLVEIDEIRTEPTQAVVDLAEDGLARQALAVWPSAHPTVDLGRQYDVVTLRKILHGAADDLLGRAIGIDVRCVEEIDAEVERLADQGPARVFRQGPGMSTPLGHPIGHAADAEP